MNENNAAIASAKHTALDICEWIPEVPDATKAMIELAVLRAINSQLEPAKIII